MQSIPDLPYDAIPGCLARDTRILPIAEDEHGIVLLTAMPFDEVQCEKLQFIMGPRKVTYADPADHQEIHQRIDEIIAVRYGKDDEDTIAFLFSD